MFCQGGYSRTNLATHMSWWSNVAHERQELADVLDALGRQRANHADVLVKLDALLQLTEDLANHPPSATIEIAAMRIRRKVIKLCGARELCSLRIVDDLIDDSIAELEAAGAQLLSLRPDDSADR